MITSRGFQSTNRANPLAKKILASEQGEEVDDAEKEYLLEYYSLVREGKTAYVSNAAFQAIFGSRGQEMPDFFKAYSVQTLTEATMFVQDLKLGHYIKVPPRATFLGKYRNFTRAKAVY